MTRLFSLWICLAVGLFGGCTDTLGKLRKKAVTNEADAFNGGRSMPSFDWALSGHRGVAPLQVFDDGQRIWLQFRSGQAVPAIFRPENERYLPVAYTLEGPYVVLPGIWPSIMLRGGHLQAMVQRAPARGVAQTQAEAPLTHPPAMQPAVELGQGRGSQVARPSTGEIAGNDRHRSPASIGLQLSDTAPLPGASAVPLQLTESAVESAPSAAPAVVSVEQGSTALTPATVYRVSPEDQTLRAALAKWAKTSGWTFEAEHWDVDADIPIVGVAEFELGFQEAVQALVASTELSDRPLQPCFYSNRVLRIVPYAQACDRRVGIARTS